jgi:murein DD-endopeptidase MepM/ murein hydrolase activator NlpD
VASELAGDMHGRARIAVAVVAAVAGLAALVMLPAVQAQVPPLDPSTTTTPPSTAVPTTSTTAVPEATTTTAPFDDPSSTPAPPGAQAGGDDTSAGKIPIPLEAQRIIDSVRRSGPSNDRALLAGVQQLEAFGLSPEESIRVGFGRFPIAGAASYVHDWLFPRFGPGFRFHLGTDVFAAYGTPVRSPVDGTAQSGNGGLGGLYVKVFMADGTYFYMAHLSGLLSGFAEGMAVKTGDVVGYVGDSGNARGGAPHVHFEVHPRGGAPIDPKPVLDQFLTDALRRLPDVVAYYRQLAGQRTAGPSLTEARQRRPLLATALLRPLLGTAVAAPLPTEVLYASGANPAAGALSILDVEAASMAHSIDWAGRSDRETARQDLLTRLEASLRSLFDPVLDPGQRDRLATKVVRG